MTPTLVDQARLPRLGDRVRVLHVRPLDGRIIEFRGPLGHRGQEVFGVELEFPDHTSYIEVPRDAFVYLDDGNDPNHPNPPATH